ncbi:DUF2330 domain-containing protein [Candidatus Uhrbacteria bacterium]|nr:DUF2330 domain-containing protein [Candidatus Uhrbacteria bacterium]
MSTPTPKIRERLRREPRKRPKNLVKRSARTTFWVKENFVGGRIKLVTRFVLVSLLLGATLLPLSSSACGCGVAFSIDPATRQWDYSSGDTNALIYYANNQERLVFARSLQAEQAADKVLIIPVPASPNSVNADVITELPNLTGKNLETVASKFLKSLNETAIATQILPWPIWKFITTPLGVNVSTAPGSAPTLGLGAPTKGIDRSVTVYQHLEKAGLVNEVITSETGEALQEYFAQKNLELDPETVPVLNSYIGKDFTFVTSWRSAQAEKTANNSVVGLSIEFPASEIFYPLIPSSTFGDTRVSEKIRVVGLFEPDLPVQLERYTTVDYMLANKDSFQLGDQTVRKSVLTYTTVSLNAPSRLLTEDLIFKRSVPWRTSLAGIFAGLSKIIWLRVIATILWIIFIASVASIFAGVFAFRRLHRQAIRTYIRLGLWNLLTIIGTTVALIRLQAIPDAMVPSPISTGQKIFFWFLFTSFVTVLSIVIAYGIIGLGEYDSTGLASLY